MIRELSSLFFPLRTLRLCCFKNCLVHNSFRLTIALALTFEIFLISLPPHLLFPLIDGSSLSSLIEQV